MTLLNGLLQIIQNIIDFSPNDFKTAWRWNCATKWIWRKISCHWTKFILWKVYYLFAKHIIRNYIVLLHAILRCFSPQCLHHLMNTINISLFFWWKFGFQTKTCLLFLSLLQRVRFHHIRVLEWVKIMPTVVSVLKNENRFGQTLTENGVSYLNWRVAAWTKAHGNLSKMHELCEIISILFGSTKYHRRGYSSRL